MNALSFIRDADWFGPDRAQGYPRAIALLYLPFLVYYFCVLAFGPHGCDFAAFWAGGRLAWSHAALAYDQETMQALQNWMAPDWWVPFNNPPPFLFAVAPFGLLSPRLGQALWILVTLALWVIACRRVIGLWPALAFTPVFWNCAVGQNGLLTGALFVAAIWQLGRRPFVAGLLFGALVIKPQLALLVPFALLAGGHWRAIAGAAVSSLGLLGLSYLVFGPGVFVAFLAGTAVSKAILLSGFHALRQPTLFAAVLALGGGPALAGILQAPVTIAVLAITVWVWRRGTDTLGKGAILAAGTALATPYVFGYDLTFLILPIAWLAREGARTGFLPWEKLVIGLVFIMPVMGEPIARLGLGFNPGVLVFFSALFLGAGAALAPCALRALEATPPVSPRSPSLLDPGLTSCHQTSAVRGLRGPPPG